MLGCMVYREDTKKFLYYPKTGDFDECAIDKSGRWLMSLENVDRSEEHTSELQSQSNLVCRLLLEKKKKGTNRKGSDRAHTCDHTPQHAQDSWADGRRYTD